MCQKKKHSNNTLLSYKCICLPFTVTCCFHPNKCHCHIIADNWMLDGGLSHSVPKFNTVALHMGRFVLKVFCLISMCAINQYTKAREKKKNSFEAPTYLICEKRHKERSIKGFTVGQ